MRCFLTPLPHDDIRLDDSHPNDHNASGSFDNNADQHTVHENFKGNGCHFVCIPNSTDKNDLDPTKKQPNLNCVNDQNVSPGKNQGSDEVEETNDDMGSESNNGTPEQPPLRRTTRHAVPPKRFKDFIVEGKVILVFGKSSVQFNVIAICFEPEFQGDALILFCCFCQDIGLPWT
ncbi:hypothetical protein QVD17_41727 [Tagetes erecta]|uniref:Uncharacterized protein n=1 Tax=Tagetes erecta TaxID=13708 RepID=A0AAD8NDW9_TARER|nr:hypothetical protein QVD17_41727 [Tagetes erecta]